MSLARCQHCGAPLELAAGALTARCSYCQHDQVVAGLVTALERAVAPAAARSAPYRAGEPVLCEWRGRWWPASILEVLPGEQYRIHYDGYSSSWDESVGRERLARRSEAESATWSQSASPVSSPKTGAAVIAAVVLVLLAGAGVAVAMLGRSAPSSAPVTAPVGGSVVVPGQLAVGQPVLVSWNQRWWNATVLRLYPDGRVRIHYDGWAESWDEDVTLDRVRLR